MDDEKEQLKELIAELQKKSAVHEKELQAEIDRLKETMLPKRLNRTDLVEAVYNDIEHYIPLPPLIPYDALRKMHGSPSGYINGQRYWIPTSSLNQPWWTRV